MKKIIALVLMTIMLLGTLAAAVTSFAADTAKITASVKVTDSKEETGSLKVTFKITNNPGLNNLVMKLGYNANTLALKTVENGEVFTPTYGGSMFEVNQKGNPLILCFEENEVGNITANGKICTVTFDIVDDKGTFDLSFTIDEDNTFRSKGEQRVEPEDVEIVSELSSTKNTQHIYSGTPTVIAPTCTEDGHTDQVCNTCGKVLNSTPGREKLGHSLKTETIPATYYSEGLVRVYCERNNCEYVESETVIPRLTVPFTVVPVDENGNEIAEKSVLSVNVGMFDINAMLPEIPGYKANTVDEVEVGEDPDENIAKIVYVARDDIEYTVKYVDENGKDIAPEKIVENCTMATEVTEKAITVAGYTATENEKKLTLAANGNQIVFTYKSTTAPESPKTGDDMMTVVLALAGALTLAGTVLVIRKKKEN